MKARDDYEKFPLIGRAEGACLSAFASWHNRQPEQKQIRTDWLPSFHFLNFFASWFYGRHIGPNHATLIFCCIDIQERKFLSWVISGQKITF